MNKHFINITKNLNLKKCPVNSISLSVPEIIDTLKNHQSIKVIKVRSTTGDIFNFRKVSTDEVKKIILSLNSNKSSLSGSIPADILKLYCDTYLSYLTEVINQSIENSVFPDELKLAEVTPVYKKNDSCKKENTDL